MKSLDVAWIDKKVRWQALTAYGLFIAFAGAGFIFRDTYPLMLIGLLACSVFVFLLGLRNKIYSFCFAAYLCLCADVIAQIVNVYTVATSIGCLGLFILHPIIWFDRERKTAKISQDGKAESVNS